MRTSAYVAPAPFAALSASAMRSSAVGSAHRPGLRPVSARTRVGAAMVSATAAALDLRKSRRLDDILSREGGVLKSDQYSTVVWRKYANRRRSVAPRSHSRPAAIGQTSR